MVSRNAAHPYLWLAIGVLANFCSIGFWILVNSMKADVCDHDDSVPADVAKDVRAIGNLIQKRWDRSPICSAGLFFSGPAMTRRLVTLSILIHSLVYAWLSQSDQLFFLALCLLLLDRYPLDRTTMADIRSELERRRAAV